MQRSLKEVVPILKTYHDSGPTTVHKGKRGRWESVTDYVGNTYRDFVPEKKSKAPKAPKPKAAPKAKTWKPPRGTKGKKNPKDGEYYFNLKAITKVPKPKLHVPKAIKRLNESRGAPDCQAPKRGVRGHTRTGKPVKGYCRNPGTKRQSGAGIKKHVKRAAKIAAYAIPTALAAYGVHKINQLGKQIHNLPSTAHVHLANVANSKAAANTADDFQAFGKNSKGQWVNTTRFWS